MHVDGVGYVCSFAVFDFARYGNVDANQPETGLEGATGPDSGPAADGFAAGKPSRPTTRRTTSSSPSRLKHRDWRGNENKMEQSFLHFKATHPDWQPSDPSSSLFLDRLMGAGTRNRHGGGPVSAATGGISGSIYGGGGGGGVGGRGLGVDGSVMAEMEEERLRAKRQSYERAWAKSSHLHRPDSSHSHPLRHPHSAASEIIEEEEGGEGDKGDDSIDGWSKRVKTDGETDDEEERERLWKDEGVVGLLQQVLGR